VIQWAEGALYDGPYVSEPVLRAVLLRLQIAVSVDSQDVLQLIELKSAMSRNEALTLDVLDLLLKLGRGNASALEDILLLGGSVWRVSEHRGGLEKRLGPTEVDAVSAATLPADLVLR
jgi:hypothetical protein